jgi:hypothetical protein
MQPHCICGPHLALLIFEFTNFPLNFFGTFFNLIVNLIVPEVMATSARAVNNAVSFIAVLFFHFNWSATIADGFLLSLAYARFHVAFRYGI